MKNKMGLRMKRMLILIVFTLLFVSSVSAIGVYPARKSEHVSEKLGSFDRNFDFTVVNNDGIPQKVGISIMGNLAEYVTLESDVIDFSAEEKEKKVNYNVNIPFNALKLGNNDITFIVSSSPTILRDGNSITANLQLITTLQIRVSDGEKKIETKKTAEIEEAKIQIAGISVDRFKLGEIAQFRVNVRNRFDETMTGVYANLEVFDLDGNLITSFKSTAENINSNNDKDLLAYWDTTSVSGGEYRSKLTVYYNDKTISRDVEMVISPDGIKTKMLGTGSAVVGEGFGFAFNSVFMIGIIVLIMINILWFVYFRKRRN